jgi:hypothetical protein
VVPSAMCHVWTAVSRFLADGRDAVCHPRRRQVRSGRSDPRRAGRRGAEDHQGQRVWDLALTERDVDRLGATVALEQRQGLGQFPEVALRALSRTEVELHDQVADSAGAPVNRATVGSSAGGVV